MTQNTEIEIPKLSWLTRIAFMLGLGEKSHAMQIAERRVAMEKELEDYMRSKLPPEVRDGDILPLVLYPNAILRERSMLVEHFDADLDQLVKSMGATMYLCGGVGLAAIQVGVPLRVFVTDLRNMEDSAEAARAKFMVFVNPVILGAGDPIPMVEGCLSMPNIRESIARPGSCAIRAQDITGKTFEIDLDGWPARVFQHELEHLDGELFLDHFGTLKRRAIEKRIAKLRKSIEIDEANSARRAKRQRARGRGR